MFSLKSWTQRDFVCSKYLRILNMQIKNLGFLITWLRTTSRRYIYKEPVKRSTPDLIGFVRFCFQNFVNVSLWSAIILCCSFIAMPDATACDVNQAFVLPKQCTSCQRFPACRWAIGMNWYFGVELFLSCFHSSSWFQLRDFVAFYFWLQIIDTLPGMVWTHRHSTQLTVPLTSFRKWGWS